jgi:hypothetical protein
MSYPAFVTVRQFFLLNMNHGHSYSVQCIQSLPRGDLTGLRVFGLTNSFINPTSSFMPMDGQPNLMELQT